MRITRLPSRQQLKLMRQSCSTVSTLKNTFHEIKELWQQRS